MGEESRSWFQPADGFGLKAKLLNDSCRGVCGIGDIESGVLASGLDGARISLARARFVVMPLAFISSRCSSTVCRMLFSAVEPSPKVEAAFLRLRNSYERKKSL
jgi:hypothetical protein